MGGGCRPLQHAIDLKGMPGMVPHADVRQLASVLESGGLVLDVREPFEYTAGHVPGAVPLPMHLVPLRIDDIPLEGPVYIVCATGNRSWQVAHFLRQHGRDAVNVTGGTTAWQAAGFPVELGTGGGETGATS